MNLMNRLNSLYLKLPHDSSFGLISKILNRLAAKSLKIILDKIVPKYLIKTQNESITGLNKTNREKVVIVSLTSFSERLDTVWIVVELMFRQTYKPDRIILWLDKNIQNKTLPKRLEHQVNKGLEIRYVEDLRSHTKYFYALQEFKNDNVITVDDDCYYPLDIIQNLIDINDKFPASIASNRVHGIVKDSKNKIVPYRFWKHNFKPKKINSYENFLTGVGGVLYPPHVFNDTLFKKEVFMQICKYADDVWLTMNAKKNGVKIKTNQKYNKDFISISKTSNVRLLNYNSKSGGNDEQIDNVLKYLEIEL